MAKLCFILFAVSVLFARCKHAEPHCLTLKDIRFPDPEKAAIIRNKIREIQGYDTTFFYIKNPKSRNFYGQKILKSANGMEAFLGDLIEDALYDSAGNRVYYLHKGITGGGLI